VAASQKTVFLLADILVEELSIRKALKILDRMAKVPGNASFRTTIQLLIKEIEDRTVEDYLEEEGDPVRKN
jgi:hypothetical protein